MFQTEPDFNSTKQFKDRETRTLSNADKICLSCKLDICDQASPQCLWREASKTTKYQYLGVYYLKYENKWRVQRLIDKKKVYLGRYESKLLAEAVAKTFDLLIHDKLRSIEDTLGYFRSLVLIQHVKAEQNLRKAYKLLKS